LVFSLDLRSCFSVITSLVSMLICSSSSMAFLNEAMDLRGLDYLSERVGAEDSLAFLMLFQMPWKR
jgi:hypothetical protein